jgi:D-glycero-D-manno-heptose 1,7-bisphosphate phosphatase
MSRPAFFLDRDGTINVDHVYINDPARIELIPGAAAAIARARMAGYLIVVVTNQSGIGRGIIDPIAMPFIHSRLDILLSGAGGPGSKIDRYELCVHHPDEDCACRKPKPFLVQEAAKALDIDISRSVFVGDKLTDVGTGINAGCRFSILVRTGKGEEEEKLDQGFAPSYVADDLSAAVDWALSR